MEQSIALRKLLEVADLVGMLEDLTMSQGGKISPASMSGLRITLRNIRESVLQSHDALAEDAVTRAKSRVDTQSMMPERSLGALSGNRDNPISQRPATLTEADKRFSRGDLKASLEKIIEG